MGKLLRRPLTIREILASATLHRESTGKWPTKDSGAVLGAKFETWLGVDAALRGGGRDLPGGSSLAQLLAKERGVRNRKQLLPLTDETILQWADEHHQRIGSWPTAKSGTVPGTDGEKWRSIDMALRVGVRRLPGGSSLARLLAKHRGVRNRKQLPKLTEEKILEWADAHFKRTVTWPKCDSGPVVDAPGETWTAVELALSHGQRGMPGGSSLAFLLAEKRNIQNVWTRPNFTIEEILAWADAWHERTGRWPKVESGPIPESQGDTWLAVNHALKKGLRGLTGGTSLAELLEIERGLRNPANAPRLSRKRILAWVDAHHRRTGTWPTQKSGPVLDSPGDTWAAVDAALNQGSRGLRAGGSLARLLEEHRGRRNVADLPRLTKKQILAWADAHHQRTGKWPHSHTGSVVDAPGERWDLIDNALRECHRGLDGESSLLLLLVKKRGVRNPLNLPPLTEDQIVQWAERHFERTGSWPHYKSGPIADAPCETWAGVDMALRRGKRGLPGGSSVAKLLRGSRTARPIMETATPVRR